MADLVKGKYFYTNETRNARVLLIDWGVGK